MRLEFVIVSILGLQCLEPQETMHVKFRRYLVVTRIGVLGIYVLGQLFL